MRECQDSQDEFLCLVVNLNRCFMCSGGTCPISQKGGDFVVHCGLGPFTSHLHVSKRIYICWSCSCLKLFPSAKWFLNLLAIKLGKSKQSEILYWVDVGNCR